MATIYSFLYPGVTEYIILWAKYNVKIQTYYVMACYIKGIWVTSIEPGTWIANYICITLWDVIIYKCLSITAELNHYQGYGK